MSSNKIQKKEIFKFLIGGGSAVITDYTVYNILLHVGIEISIAKTISFISGSFVGFIINKLWTFESKYFSKSEIVRYIILYTITAFVNISVNKGVLFIINMKIIGFLCATGVSTIMNFFGQKYFVFNKKAFRFTIKD